MLSLFLYLLYKKTQKAYVINKGVILIIPKVDLLSTSLEVFLLEKMGEIKRKSFFKALPLCYYDIFSSRARTSAILFFIMSCSSKVSIISCVNIFKLL